MRIAIDISEYDKEWIGNAYGIPQDINTKIAEAIINAEPCQPEPHWIPVTERLPNRDELVLVTYKTTSKIHLCKYLDDGSENSWWSYIDDCCAWNNVILAWMPLPEPYKGAAE